MRGGFIDVSAVYDSVRDLMDLVVLTSGSE